MDLDPQTLHSAALVAAGLLIGILLSLLIARARIQTVRAQLGMEAGVEIAGLNGRIAALSDELGTAESAIAELSGRERQMREQLDLVRDERAHLLERAGRLPGLEQQLGTALQTDARLQQELSTARAQLAEKLQALSDLERRLAEQSTESHALQQRHEQLQRELRAESNRAAGLAEQNLRIAELESALKSGGAEAETLRRDLGELKEAHGRTSADLEGEQRRAARLEEQLAATVRSRDELQAERTALKSRIAELETTLESERRQGEEKLALLSEAKEQLTHQFKSLANEILEEKSKRFSEQNQQSLGQLLEPLKTRLQEFQGKVEEVYVQEGKDRSALAEQVRHLMALNKQISEDAINLTRALKGSGKTQGNWGELVLERVLEASGLRKGFEYDVQSSHTREDGSRAQPDVIVHLPEGRHIVIDSKASLVAYEEHVNADSDAQREVALRRHLESVRTHIKGLSEKNYQALYELKSLDFVLMFLPIEPAFMLAVTHDSELWQEAWRKNVLLVSPSTLLFVVRTIAHLWRQEQQNRNAQEIARRGGELYDRLSAFVSDLEKVGDRLRQAQESYVEARDKLCRRRGNVIRQAEMLKDLGVKPSRSLPSEMIEGALEDATGLPQAALEPEPLEEAQ